MLTNHLDQNHPSPQSDPCSLNFNSVNDLDRHKLYDCEKITVQCPLQSIRCEEMIPRIHLSRYYLSDQHQKVLTKVVLRMLLNLSIQVSQTINILSDGVGNLVDELESLSTECDQLVMVDFGNIPNGVTPYILRLSSGLTIGIQETMIQQETEKQQKLSYSSTMSAETDQFMAMN
ncbi:unnamed protein product [Rotaria socialis]|uniref:Uncharacterized protein n=1 Tax=Rotaria socialis TaxID=392032 RepID=A0A818F8D3_9BILA|nr:unnamed protein product [Rotaria socialis]CAF3471133.1 unnamed protein product [Rotaria socialis]